MIGDISFYLKYGDERALDAETHFTNNETKDRPHLSLLAI